MDCSARREMDKYVPLLVIYSTGGGEICARESNQNRDGDLCALRAIVSQWPYEDFSDGRRGKGEISRGTILISIAPKRPRQQ